MSLYSKRLVRDLVSLPVVLPLLGLSLALSYVAEGSLRVSKLLARTVRRVS